jgi:hypothetical protein
VLTLRQLRLVERDQRFAVEAERFDQSRFSIESGGLSATRSTAGSSAGAGAFSSPSVCWSSPD